jgi:hypothetical protein
MDRTCRCADSQSGRDAWTTTNRLASPPSLSATRVANWLGSSRLSLCALGSNLTQARPFLNCPPTTPSFLGSRTPPSRRHAADQDCRCHTATSEHDRKFLIQRGKKHHHTAACRKVSKPRGHQLHSRQHGGNPALDADAIVDVPNGDDPTIEVNSSDTNFNDALQVRIHLYTCTVRWLCAGFFFNSTVVRSSAHDFCSGKRQ